MKATKIFKSTVLAAFAVLIFGAGAFAELSDCMGDGNRYPNLSTTAEDGYVKCVSVKEGDSYVTIYGKSSSDCAQAGSLASDPDSCNSGDLNNVIQTIINTIIFVVGMVAVIMIILGGVSYATSQGDAGKVKKGKDTIMYGIIGLVISILAFAIVNFVLSSLAN